MPAVPIGEIVAFVGGRYDGPPDLALHGIAPLSEATPEQLSFLANPKYSAQVPTTRAGAVLVADDFAGGDARLIRVKNPYLAMANIAAKWFATRRAPRGISPLASISPTATLGRDVNVGPFATIGDDVTIGDGVKIGKHCLLVAQVGIAGSTELGDSVVVAGQSGFSGHLKIGNRVQVAAKSAVLDDVPDDGKVMGSPAMPFRDFARREALLKRLMKKKPSP